MVLNNVIAYGVEIELFREDESYYDTVGMEDEFYVERLAAMSAGFSRDAPSLQVLCVRQINRELDQYDFSHYLPRAAMEIIQRIGKAGRRGDSKSLRRTCNRIKRDFNVAACRALDIELEPFPDKQAPDYEAAKDAWFEKCPLWLRIDVGNAFDPEQHVEGAWVKELQVTLYLKATRSVTQWQERGDGVTSRRLNLEPSEEQSRQLATVIAALRLKTKGPPGGMRITVT